MSCLDFLTNIIHIHVYTEKCSSASAGARIPSDPKPHRSPNRSQTLTESISLTLTGVQPNRNHRGEKSAVDYYEILGISKDATKDQISK
eukprot:1337340-Amorphochlora_amoeboformis.AAC.1